MVIFSRYFLLIVSLQLVLSPLVAVAPKASLLTDSPVNFTESSSIKKTCKKRNWKKIALAIGIPVAVVVAGIGTKVVYLRKTSSMSPINAYAQGASDAPLVGIERSGGNRFELVVDASPNDVSLRTNVSSAGAQGTGNNFQFMLNASRDAVLLGTEISSAGACGAGDKKLQFLMGASQDTTFLVLVLTQKAPE